jgi:hypothetical protein
VQLWDNGTAAATVTKPPYQFDVPESLLASGFVQVTAKTASGDEAADFWSPAGNIVAEEMLVRTIPTFVSVIDRDGNTRDDVDRSQSSTRAVPRRATSSVCASLPPRRADSSRPRPSRT